jgi:hypothetical protein
VVALVAALTLLAMLATVGLARWMRDRRRRLHHRHQARTADRGHRCSCHGSMPYPTPPVDENWGERGGWPSRSPGPGDPSHAIVPGHTTTSTTAAFSRLTADPAPTTAPGRTAYPGHTTTPAGAGIPGITDELDENDDSIVTVRFGGPDDPTPRRRASPAANPERFAFPPSMRRDAGTAPPSRDHDLDDVFPPRGRNPRPVLEVELVPIEPTEVIPFHPPDFDAPSDDEDV